MAGSFGWAFIGTGTLARKVIREITATGRHRVVSAYSRNREKLQAFCEPYGTYPATSVDDAILHAGVDAVYISVTNESHYSICRQCLEQGKHVLLEKPFTISAPETESLQELAREKGLYLSEAMWTWYSEVPYKVLDIVRSGRLGRIRSVYMAYSMYSIDYAPRVSDPLLGGGAVLDIGIYPIAYAYKLFGYPKAISCKGDVRNGVDYGEEIVFSYDGFDVRMDVSIVGTKGEAMLLEAENGMIANTGFHYAEPALVKTGDSIEILQGKKGYVVEFDNVAGEIRQGRTESAFIPPRMTLDCMRILDECRRQMGLVYPFESQS